MILTIECIILCTIFTVIIIPSLYKNPLSLILSYPTAIRKRVDSLPQYADIIKGQKNKHLLKKILSIPIIAIVLSVIAYYSGANNFSKVFMHTFLLFFVVNLYDLIILDLGFFCHSKKSIIPGTEDMIDEYKNPRHHIIGSIKGIILGIIVGLLCGGIVSLYNILNFPS